MGHKQSRTASADAPLRGQTSFKLFEYQCPTCKSKRPIQYFLKDGKFLPQAPRVVCGECNTSVTVEPFKTVEYGCPSCKKWQKARMPARPIPLNMYNVSVVSCNCGFKGEVGVGRLMDVSCSQCWQSRRELCDIWIEDGAELRTHCGCCQDYQRSFAQLPKKRNAEQRSDMEYTCVGCSLLRPIAAEELLRSEGLACCSSCSWVGYPEVHPQGHFEKIRKHREETRRAGDTPKKKDDKVRRHKEKAKVQPEPDPMPVVPSR